MRRWMKRAAAGALLVCASAGLFATPASAQPGQLCARADVWVNPLTYLQKCVNMPGYPSAPNLP